MLIAYGKFQALLNGITLAGDFLRDSFNSPNRPVS